MFDIGFLELIVICVVALLVLGPDKMPGAVKTLALWIGRLRRSFNNIRREIEQEVGADEIRRQLRNEAIMEKFNSARNQVNETIQSVKKETDTVKNDLDLNKQFPELTGESRAPEPKKPAVGESAESGEQAPDKAASADDKPASGETGQQ